MNTWEEDGTRREEMKEGETKHKGLLRIENKLMDGGGGRLMGDGYV